MRDGGLGGAARLALVLAVMTTVLLAGGVAWALASSSGVSGKVYVGPLGPVRRTLPGEDGDEMPYVATLVFTSEDSTAVVAIVRSDARGEFRVSLPPGFYLLRPQDSEYPFPKARKEYVQVKPGRYADVIVMYDTWAGTR